MFFLGDVYRDSLDQRYGSTKDYGVLKEPVEEEEEHMKPNMRDTRWSRFMNAADVKSEVNEDELMEIQGPIPKRKNQYKH